MGRYLLYVISLLGNFRNSGIPQKLRNPGFLGAYGFPTIQSQAVDGAPLLGGRYAEWHIRATGGRSVLPTVDREIPETASAIDIADSESGGR